MHPFGVSVNRTDCGFSGPDGSCRALAMRNALASARYERTEQVHSRSCPGDDGLTDRPFSAPSNPHARRHPRIRARAAKTFSRNDRPSKPREKLQPCRVSLPPLPRTHVTCAPGRARHAKERGDPNAKNCHTNRSEASKPSSERGSACLLQALRDDLRARKLSDPRRLPELR